jgi:hypothetical protein
MDLDLKHRKSMRTTLHLILFNLVLCKKYHDGFMRVLIIPDFVGTWNGGSSSTCKQKTIYGRWMIYQVLDLVRPILPFNT